MFKLSSPTWDTISPEKLMKIRQKHKEYRSEIYKKLKIKEVKKMRLLHRHDDQLRKIEQLTEELEKNPAMTAFRDQQTAENLKVRQEAAMRLEALKQAAVELAGNQDTDSLVEKLNTLDIERRELQSEIGDKRRQLTQQKAGIEAAIQREQEILYSSYSPEIDTAIQFFRDKLDELRSPGRISSQRTGLVEKNIFSEKIKSKIESNFNAVTLALRYCQEAIRSLEASKLQAAVDMDKIQKLKDNIPRTDTYTEGEAERQMPGTKTPNPSSLLPSDEAMEWKKNTVLEKAKKLLKR